MLPNLIVMVGDIGSGKTAVADYLVANYGYEKRTFAAALKTAVHEVFGPLGMEARHLWGTQEDKNEVIPGIENSGRRILQLVGTEGYRTAYPDVWAKFVLNTIDGLTIIDDGRFANEVELVREAGGEVWRVIRPNNPITGFKDHASEGYWMTAVVDAQIVAEHIEGLHAAVKGVMNESN